MGLADPAWVQLTYASTGSGSEEGAGWGVKDVRGATDGMVLDTLRDGVALNLEEVVPTPRFASDAELEIRPRRLVYRLENGQPVLWHSVAAGNDAAGRPGNVFTHAAALVSSPGDLRPIDLWRSADWLVPFGIDDVTRAGLGEPPRPGPVVSRQSISDFVRQRQHLLTMEWLLAAVSDAQRTNRTLALATETADVAAMWLGAVSHLTAPALIRRLSWITYERASTLPETMQRGFNIICIPRADLGELLGAARGVTDRWLVLDPSWQLDSPPEGTDWQYDYQSFQADSRWQNAMFDAFALDDDRLWTVLATMDELCAGLTPGEALQLKLRWPLLAALLVTPGVTLADRDQALAECLATAPASALQHPHLRELAYQRRAILPAPPPDPSQLLVGSASPDWSPAVDAGRPSVPEPIGAHAGLSLARSPAAIPAFEKAAPAPQAIAMDDHEGPIRMMERLWVEATEGSDRQWAIGDCLLIELGLRSVPLVAITDDLADQRRMAEARLADQAPEAIQRGLLVSWLAGCYALLAGRPDAGPTPGPAPLVTGEAAVEGIARCLREADVPIAAAIVASALRSELSLDPASFLAGSGPDRGTLGWTAVRRAMSTMPDEHRRNVLSGARSRIDGAVASVVGGRGDVLLADLLNPQGEW